MHETSCQLLAFSLQLEPELIESSVFLIRSNLGWKLEKHADTGRRRVCESKLALVAVVEIGSKQEESKPHPIYSVVRHCPHAL